MVCGSLSFSQRAGAGRMNALSTFEAIAVQEFTRYDDWVAGVRCQGLCLITMHQRYRVQREASHIRDYQTVYSEDADLHIVAGRDRFSNQDPPLSRIVGLNWRYVKTVC
jgi:hypothetical protein